MSNYRNDYCGSAVNVYTHGSCKRNGLVGAHAGVGVFFDDDHCLNFSGPLDKVSPPTNNNAEIQAATRACQIAIENGICNLNIHTDSQFLIDCWEDYIPNKWLINGWKNCKRNEVANRRQLEELLKVNHYLRFEFFYVPGHSGIYGNVKALQLAQQGAKEYIVECPYCRLSVRGAQMGSHLNRFCRNYH